MKDVPYLQYPKVLCHIFEVRLESQGKVTLPKKPLVDSTHKLQKKSTSQRMFDVSVAQVAVLGIAGYFILGKFTARYLFELYLNSSAR